MQRICLLRQVYPLFFDVLQMMVEVGAGLFRLKRNGCPYIYINVCKFFEYSLHFIKKMLNFAPLKNKNNQR